MLALLQSSFSPPTLAAAVSPSGVNDAFMQVLRSSLTASCDDLYTLLLAPGVQELYASRLSQASEVTGAEQPPPKKHKLEITESDNTTVAIKINSMDGSSVTAAFAPDATIKDVKTSVFQTLRIVPGALIIQLHVIGEEEALPDTRPIRALFFDKDPVLFMFQKEPDAEYVKLLDGNTKQLREKHTRELEEQAVLIEACLASMRAKSDGESCQKCMTRIHGSVSSEPEGSEDHSESQEPRMTLAVCTGRCGLLLCSECRPVLCELCEDMMEHDSDDGVDGGGDCCEDCWPTKFQNTATGACECAGCSGRGDPDRGRIMMCREGYCQLCSEDNSEMFGEQEWSPW